MNITLTLLDYIIIAVFFLIIIFITFIAAKKSKGGSVDYFLGGGKMPWWLLGTSMVACTFSADTPNLVTGMVRDNGIAANWAWWAFLITGMTTVFIFASLWKKSKIITDLEFYEKRYSGKSASFLRGFRAVYLGFFFNVLIIGSVSIAAIKIGAVMFNIKPLYTIIFGSSMAVIYTVLGGFRGVVWADFFQYIIAMAGAIAAAIFVLDLPEVGSMQNLISNPNVIEKLNIIPDVSDPKILITLLIIPIAIQWWSVWYPGSEPGGGGYMAQKMLSAKNEKHAVGATLFFNFAHYALRPWPWIIVALASLVVFAPDSKEDMQKAKETLNTQEYKEVYKDFLTNQNTLTEKQLEEIKTLHFQSLGLSKMHQAFPEADVKYLKSDAAYPMMITKMNKGWLGLIIASLIAAYMSTIATHLNWGASYIVNDVYKRFLSPNASDRKVKICGMITTIVIMLMGAIVSLTIMESATQAFDILLLSGAGTGAVYILRWFWWRINAQTEIIAMISATIMAIIMVFVVPDGCLENSILDHSTMRLLIVIAIVSIIWLVSVFITKPEDEKTLIEFYSLTTPGGKGWKKIVENAQKKGIKIEDYKKEGSKMPLKILAVFVGILTVYFALFAIGNFVLLNHIYGVILSVLAILGIFALLKISEKIKF